MRHLEIEVTNAAELLATEASGAGALLRWESSATEAGPYVEGGTEAQRVKFYTDLWHALLGRRTLSDVDGHYCDMTGDRPMIRRVRLDREGRPLHTRTTISTRSGARSGT